ncbi:MAG: cytochrome c biogenesis protein CcsA, partial [Pseudomonadota bacterium]
MSSVLLAPLCALLYLAASGRQLWSISQGDQRIGASALTLGLTAMALHAYLAWNIVVSEQGISLGFFKISAVIFLFINVACVASLARRPLQNLLVVLFPLAALSVLISSFAPETGGTQPSMSAGLLLHVGSSILAYAVLTLAAAQSAVLWLQDSQLRQHNTGGIVRILPPLQLMESMLFELLWVGVSLLTVAIVSGFVFV